jgi:hypothetical protein
MTSQIIPLLKIEDLEQLKGWHIEECRNVDNSIELVVSHITAPNAVLLRINIGMMSFNGNQIGTNYRIFGYIPQFAVTTEDVIKEKT